MEDIMQYKKLIIEMIEQLNDAKMLYRIYHYVLIKFRKDKGL